MVCWPPLPYWWILGGQMRQWWLLFSKTSVCMYSDAAKFRVSERHLMDIFSKLRRFSSATQMCKLWINLLNLTNWTACRGLSGLQEATVTTLHICTSANWNFCCISLPKAKKDLPNECKLLHAVQIVKFNVFKSKIIASVGSQGEQKADIMS